MGWGAGKEGTRTRPDRNPEGAGALQAWRRNLPLAAPFHTRPRATPAGRACALAPERRKRFRRERSAGVGLLPP